MLRKILVGALCTLALVACGKTIDGLLTNTEALTFNVKGKTFSLPAGHWETAIQFASKTEVRLNIQIPGKQDATVVAFKVLKSNPLPQENGTFELLSEDSGQPYDVSGSVATTHVDSQEEWQQESCTYQIYQPVCHYQNGHPVCYSVPYTYSGWRDVRFFTRSTTQTVEFSLLSATKTTPGTFKAVDHSTRRIYTMEGQCR